jgi:hypothetical protein
VVKTTEFTLPKPESLRDIINGLFGDIDRPVLTYSSGEGDFTITFRDTTLDTDRVVDRGRGEIPIVVTYDKWVFKGPTGHEGLDEYLSEHHPTILKTSPQLIREETPYEDAWQGNLR